MRVAVGIAIAFALLAAVEVTLHVWSPAWLHLDDSDERNLLYQYDPELGWLPVPGSTKPFVARLQTEAATNALGLRDTELGDDPRPRILVLGDSFVWGYGVQAADRFTEVLQKELPASRVVNAGVSGYGTDQEYLLMNRLWGLVRPAVVLLIVCTHNDRDDNSRNQVYGGYYKPFFRMQGDGDPRLDGEPVPKSTRYWFADSSPVWRSAIARLVVAAFVALRDPAIVVRDPTTGLIRLMRRTVEEGGARFAVGLTGEDAKLEEDLRRAGIPFVSFPDAETFDGKKNYEHWTPAGHALVASRLASMLARLGVSR